MSGKLTLTFRACRVFELHLVEGPSPTSQKDLGIGLGKHSGAEAAVIVQRGISDETALAIGTVLSLLVSCSYLVH